MRANAGERPRDPLEVERLDEEHRVPLLAVPHEAVQLLLERAVSVGGLLLVGAERAQLVLLREHALHAVGPDCPRELVLEVARAGVEAGALELLTVVATECAEEVPFLA